jgi:hypothetical protein
VDTIKSVGSGGTVRISSMDWLGQSQYMIQTVYWSTLSSAISEVTSNVTAPYFLETLLCLLLQVVSKLALAAILISKECASFTWRGLGLHP